MRDDTYVLDILKKDGQAGGVAFSYLSSLLASLQLLLTQSSKAIVTVLPPRLNKSAILVHKA
jgi:hypothetical protein